MTPVSFELPGDATDASLLLSSASASATAVNDAAGNVDGHLSTCCMTCWPSGSSSSLLGQEAGSSELDRALHQQRQCQLLRLMLSKC